MMLELSWIFVCLGGLSNFSIAWGAEKIDGPLFAREGVSSQATLWVMIRNAFAVRA